MYSEKSSKNPGVFTKTEEPKLFVEQQVDEITTILSVEAGSVPE
jgi:hypothetical protein